MYDIVLSLSSWIASFLLSLTCCARVWGCGSKRMGHRQNRHASASQTLFPIMIKSSTRTQRPRSLTSVSVPVPVVRT